MLNTSTCAPGGLKTAQKTWWWQKTWRQKIVDELYMFHIIGYIISHDLFNNQGKTCLRTLNLRIIQCGLPLLDLGTDYFNSLQSVSSTMSPVSSAIGFAMLPSVWTLTDSKPGFLSQFVIFRGFYAWRGFSRPFSLTRNDSSINHCDRLKC